MGDDRKFCIASVSDASRHPDRRAVRWLFKTERSGRAFTNLAHSTEIEGR